MGITFIAAVSAVCPAGSIPAVAAAGGYGPPPPCDCSALPGSYSGVIASQVIPQAGGAIGPTVAGRATVTLVIPAGAFPVPVQITLTGPKPFAGGGHSKAVAGLGIRVQENGTTYTGTALKPLTLTVRSSSITSSSVVMVWNGTNFVIKRGCTVAAHVAIVRFDTGRDFAVLSPGTTTAKAPIPDAATSMAGKPFAGALIVLEASGLVAG